MAEQLQCTVKSESDTRWSAREGAVRVIATKFTELVELLQSLNEDGTESADTRGKAGNLLTSLLTFEFVCFLSLWEQVLPKINIIQKRLQSPKMNLQEAAADLNSLRQNLMEEREKYVNALYKKDIRLQKNGILPLTDVSDEGG